MARKRLKVVEQLNPIIGGFVYPNNYDYYSEKYPTLVNEENVKKASNRAFSRKEDLFVVEPVNMLVFEYDSKRYTITQILSLMLDGCSTPVRMGDIEKFGSAVQRGFYVHDLIYGIFHEVSRKVADKIFKEFLRLDGCNALARAKMYLALRLAGKKARKLDPKEHWNYGRASLTVEDL